MSYDDDVHQSPWTRPGFIAAALVVAIVLVLGIFIATRGNASNDPTPPPTSGSEPASSTEPEPEPSQEPGTESDPSICGLDDVELQGTLTQAPETEWSLIGTTAAPSVEGAGPGLVEESGLRSCYSRTPEGALLAAANFMAMSTDPALLRPMIEQGAVDGPGRDALLDLPDPAGDPAAVRVQVAGFNLLEYDGNTATVDLALSVSNGTQGAWAYRLAWEGGDWKLVVRSDGSPATDPTQLPDLTGYIPWAGV